MLCLFLSMLQLAAAFGKTDLLFNSILIIPKRVFRC